MGKKHTKMLQSHFDALPILIEFVKSMKLNTDYEVVAAASKTLRDWDKARDYKNE